MIPRVVFDTNTVVSALLFSRGRLAWLRTHWKSGECLPLISTATAAELNRFFKYPKFRLSSCNRLELLADYLPYCEPVEIAERCPIACRDTADQPFLDLAQSGRADFLVSGYQDLLILAGKTVFGIENPDAYRSRVPGSTQSTQNP